MTNELTIIERDALSTCEAVIERGLHTFVEVGSALLRIRDERLYRQTHGTFEDYCRERWQMSRPRAYQLIDAAQTVQNLGMSTIVDTPQTESQARELVPLDPDDQRLAWNLVQQTAPAGKITAAHVKSVVTVLQEIRETGALDPGTGDMLPIAEAVKAAITEETYERMKRQELHIAEKQNGNGKPHVANNSGENEWYTPAHLIESARRAMGAINLDPASSATANRIVQASHFYSASDNGLAQEWFGSVWLNPPYAQPLITQFANKLAEEYRCGRIGQACVLVNNATETAWFNTILECASAFCFLRGRVKFLDPSLEATGAPLQGQIVLYVGPFVNAFVDAFSEWGAVIPYVQRARENS